ncbi:hypothetical protein PHYSODRAFT_312791 [Phytophthora sojae]|uniref:NmrA-like domain-containing protein n=1 Tax=Phytophthora sojae (strain P6497) TaxID=1094619 RepID=G4Z9U5_PHYSP|nr:hypothetical protein PHYSODRAFT_312791 [Phytophthora sojae]EGZ19798.1 hypothetical protein PHYSODRAFT_312791 [Phytophthora sojae]|eukprot:XP_009522515.1 hypothetical protein PHYSODRAFT_312791 [Phytophthora sojae]
MSTFTKFTVVGAGGVGYSIVDGLLNANTTVTILTRDRHDETALQTALAGTEVVVCAVDAQHHSIQYGVARAAKAAGVQLFVPTEVGSLICLTALFLSGFWSEYLPFVLGFNFKEGTMSVVGDGNAKLGIVSRADFGRFVAHALSDRMSPKEIAAMAEKKLGKTIELKVVDCEKRKKNYDTDSMAYILTRMGDGRLIPGTEEEVKETVAKFFPDWNPTPFDVAIA